MRTRALARCGAVTLGMIGVLAGAPADVAGQTRAEIAEAAREASPRTAEEAMTFFEDAVAERTAEAIASVYDPTKPPVSPPMRTPWGDPDLRGFWLSLSYTPLERPEQFADKPLLTPQEAIEFFTEAVIADSAVDPATVPLRLERVRDGYVAKPGQAKPSFRADRGPGQREASAVVAGRAGAPRRGGGRGGDHEPVVGGVAPEEFLHALHHGEPGGPPRLPFNHDSESQIIQTPGYVLIITQSNSEVRVVPMDGRPHLPSQIRTWLGDSRGHWEGETLVVETTNFHPERIWRQGRNATPDMSLVERFTRVDRDTISYEITVEDPATWTQPWTAEIPWPAIEPPLFEFACHEQNYGVINVVTGAQIRATEGLPAGRRGGT